MIQTGKWVGTFLFLGAAIMLSSNSPVSKYGMILFLVGHVILTSVFVTLKDKPMIFQNGTFIGIDIYGVYNWWMV